MKILGALVAMACLVSCGPQRLSDRDVERQQREWTADGYERKMQEAGRGKELEKTRRLQEEYDSP